MIMQLHHTEGNPSSYITILLDNIPESPELPEWGSQTQNPE